MLSPKKAEKIQNEIYRKIPPEKRLKLTFKINDRIFKIAKKKMKSEYPYLDPISFSKEFYKHLSFNREFYEDLFNRFLKKELKKY